MNKVQTIILALAVLMINNIALIYYLKGGTGTAQPSNNALSKSAIQPKISEKESSNYIDQHNGGNLNKKGKSKRVAVSKSGDLELQAELKQAVQEYMASQDFTGVLDSYRATREQQQADLQSNFSSMTAADLLNAYQVTTDKRERQTILQYLTNTDLSSVDAYDLKQLYNDDIDGEIHDWTKSKLVVELLDRQDDEALNIAKQFLTESKNGRGIRMEVLSKTFEFDRDYVVNLASNMSIDELSNSFILNAIGSDSSAVTEFYENQLDNILAADNQKVFESLYQGPGNFDLTANQQDKVSDLMLSKRTSALNFALGMAGNIDDISILRDRFDRLSTAQDRQAFMYGLYRNNKSEPHVELMRELASASDDPNIKLWGQQGFGR